MIQTANNDSNKDLILTHEVIISLTLSTFRINQDKLTIRTILIKFSVRYAVFVLVCKLKLLHSILIVWLFLSFFIYLFTFFNLAGWLQRPGIWKWLNATRHIRPKRLLKVSLRYIISLLSRDYFMENDLLTS